MIVLGIDPSTVGAAFAVIESTGSVSTHIEYVGHGVWDDLAGCANWLRDYRFREAPLVAIERPAGIHVHAKAARGANAVPIGAVSSAMMQARSIGTALMATSYVVGRLVERFEALGFRVLEISPERWRSAVCGNPHPKNADEVVERHVRLYVRNWPKRSNNHHRDAGGVAVAAAITKF